MNKLKINSGLLALILLASLLVGWSTTLTLAVLILIFCEMDEKTKNIFTRIITFCVAITLFALLWDLITSGVNLAINTFNDFIALINSYLDYSNQINLGKLNQYLLNPISDIVGIADSLMAYILTFVKFSFAVSILTGKTGKPNFVIKKIEEYVNAGINFVSSFSFNNNQTAQQQYNSYQQTQPMNPQPQNVQPSQNTNYNQQQM